MSMWVFDYALHILLCYYAYFRYVLHPDSQF